MKNIIFVQRLAKRRKKSADFIQARSTKMHDFNTKLLYRQKKELITHMKSVTMRPVYIENIRYDPNTETFCAASQPKAE